LKAPLNSNQPTICTRYEDTKGDVKSKKMGILDYFSVNHGHWK